MRILYYSPHPTLRLESLSGYGTHMRAMIRAFRELGHEVDSLVLGDALAQTSEVVSPRGTTGRHVIRRLVPRVLWNSAKDLSICRFDQVAARRLKAIIHGQPPDLVYERAAYLQVSGVMTCRQSGVPHVLEMNSPYVEERLALGGPTLLRRRAVAAERMQLQSTQLIAIVSDALRESMIRQHGIPREKFLVTPNGIFPEDHKDSARDSMRPEGVSPATPVIGFAGSIFRWHGLDILIRALHCLPKTEPAPHVMIIGDGEPLADLKRLARELGLAHRIHFTGSVPHSDVFRYLAGCDIAVLPASHWYGSPVKLFEYGALGLPIVAVRNGPVSEVMRDGEHGVLVDGSVEQLTAALRRMLDNMEWAASLGAAFRERVLAQHTWRRNAQAVLRAQESRGVDSAGNPGG